MKYFKILILSIVAFCSIQTEADIITLEFEAIVADGSFAGQSGFGSISYDDTNLLLVDEEFLGFNGSSFADFDALTAFSFSFLGQNFDQSDDSDYPDTPLFSLFDGLADSLDIFIEDGVNNLITDQRIVDFQIFGEFLGGGLRDSNNGFDFEVDMFITERQINGVPVPHIFGLFALAFGLICARKQTRKLL